MVSANIKFSGSNKLYEINYRPSLTGRIQHKNESWQRVDKPTKCNTSYYSLIGSTCFGLSPVHTGFGCLEAVCWPSVSRVETRPKPSVFQGEKIHSRPSFGREVKPFVPCRRFTACKRSLNVTWKSDIFR